MMIRYNINQPAKLKTSFNIYVISYQDEDVYQHLVQQIIDFHQLQERHPVDIAQAADWLKIEELTQNYELFAQTKCFEFQMSKTGLNCKTLPKMTPLDGDVFIFKTSVFKHKLLEQMALNNQTCMIQSYQPKVNELWQWLSPKLKEIQLDPTINQWFLQQPHLNFSQCQQALEKIQLSGVTTLTLVDIKNHLGISTPEENWAPLIDAWMQGNNLKALNLLRQARLAQHELTLLVWLLGRNIQVLYALKQALRPAQEIFASYKIWPQQINQFQQCLTLFSQTQLSKMIHLIGEVDNHVKTGKISQAWLKLEQFIIPNRL